MKVAYGTIRVERPEKHIVVVTLNRPESANAFNTQMAEELVSFWRKVEAGTTAVRAIVLTGEGTRAFSAGADLKERRDMTTEAWTRQHEIFEAMAGGIMNSSVPVIAAVNGSAVGGGLELVLACDFAYAVPEAKFAFTEVTLGIIPGIGGTQNLPRAVGLRRAKELLTTGRRFSAQEAHDWGMINRLCPAGELNAQVLDCARAIAENAPLAVAAARRAAADGYHLPLREGIALELGCYYGLIDSADRREGIAAFNEKRKPRFQGT